MKKLGFGLMRLPKVDENTIDIEQTKKMVDMFMEAGFTPREIFKLATKNAAWIGCKSTRNSSSSIKKCKSRFISSILCNKIRC